jgi:hypothetical protein
MKRDCFMATETRLSQSGDASILTRLIGAEDAPLPPEAAKALLSIRFTDRDLARIHELAVKNQDGALTPAERADLESYLRVSSFLDLVHALAGRALRNDH